MRKFFSIRAGLLGLIASLPLAFANPADSAVVEYFLRGTLAGGGGFGGRFAYDDTAPDRDFVDTGTPSDSYGLFSLSSWDIWFPGVALNQPSISNENTPYTYGVVSIANSYPDLSQPSTVVFEFGQRVPGGLGESFILAFTIDPPAGNPNQLTISPSRLEQAYFEATLSTNFTDIKYAREGGVLGVEYLVDPINDPRLINTRLYRVLDADLSCP